MTDRAAIIEIYEVSPEKSLAWCNARDVSGCGGDASLLRQQQEWFRIGAQTSGVASDEEYGTYGVYCYRRIGERAMLEKALDVEIVSIWLDWYRIKFEQERYGKRYGYRMEITIADGSRWHHVVSLLRGEAVVINGLRICYQTDKGTSVAIGDIPLFVNGLPVHRDQPQNYRHFLTFE